MKKQALLLSTLMVFFTCTTVAKEEGLFKKNTIRFTPAEMLYFMVGIRPSSTVELTYERHLPMGFSPQVVVSYALPIDFNFKEDPAGIKCGLELKKYLKSDVQRLYVSLETYYMVFSFNKRVPFGGPTSPSLIWYSDPNLLRVKGRAFVNHAKFGVSITKKGLNIDFFLGLGSRYRRVTHSNDPNGIWYRGDNPSILEEYFFGAGKGWQFSLVSGIRFGIPF